MRNDIKDNKIILVVRDVWFKFKSTFKRYDTPYYNETVEAVLKCADPQFGFRQYMCLHCGKDSKVVAFSCKSKFCIRCGRVNGEKFSHNIKDRLHPDVVYRHLVLTIPEQNRQFFYENKETKEVYSAFFGAGWACINDFVSEVFGFEAECGCVMVMHTVGRTGEYKPHLHVLLMAGGINKEKGSWEVLDKFPYKILHKSWKKCLLKMLRDFDTEGKYAKTIDFVDKKYPKGFVARIEKGNLPKDSKHLVRYISKYLCRPQISQKRIKRYDADCGEVEFSYKSHKTKKMETEVLSSMNFLGRLVQQILPKGFQRIRYFGLQASKNSDRLKYHVSKAVGTLYLPEAKLEEIKKPDSAKKGLTYRDIVKVFWGKDPFECHFCGEIMELGRIWKPVEGVVYDVFKNSFGADIGPPGELPLFLIPVV